MSLVGRNVIELRTNAGLTQVQLAERAGVGRSTIARIEADDEKEPLAATVDALAHALGVPAERLTGAPIPTESPVTLQYQEAISAAHANGITPGQLLDLVRVAVRIKAGA